MDQQCAIRVVTIVNPRGFHLRPADLFVKTAQKYQSTIEVIKGHERFDGRSVLSLITTAAMPGTELTLSAVGPDAEAAVAELVDVITRGFVELDAEGDG